MISTIGNREEAFPPLTLQAQGFTLTLTPLSPYRDPICQLVFFNGMLSLQTEAPVEEHSLETFIECYLSDLDRLREQLETHLHRLQQQRLLDSDDPVAVGKHIDTLLTGEPVESKTWVPLELEFQLTCLDGEMWHEGETLAGYFAIRIMIQAKMKPTEGQQVRAYTGYEGSVNIQEVMTFCNARRSCTTHYEQL